MWLVVQAIEEQYHLDNLQLDYERRAQERREALHRDDFHLYMPPPSFEDTTNVISNELQTEIYPAAPVEPIDAHENSFSHPIPAPRYISQGMSKYTNFDWWILSQPIFRWWTA